MAISKNDFDGLMGLDRARWELMGSLVQADDGPGRGVRAARRSMEKHSQESYLFSSTWGHV